MKGESKAIAGGEELASPLEAARQFSVSRSLIYKLIKTKKIPHYRVGSSVRISMAELRAVLRLE
jgi:excisionase family DNA binding protein